MDLFHVERFYGEDEDPKNAQDETMKNKKLKKLLKKAKLREIEKQSTEGVSKNDSVSEENGEQKAKDDVTVLDEKKKKKRKREESIEDITAKVTKSESTELSIEMPLPEDTDAAAAEEPQINDTDNIVKESSLKVITKSITGMSKQALPTQLPDWIKNPMYTDKTKEECLELNNCNFLSATVTNNLKLQNITHLFPIQNKVIPYILNQYHEHSNCPIAGLPARDVCVSAPTGSGKTLCYAIPVVQILSATKITRLQCLVISPSKDLASQIKTVFDQIVKGTHLKVGLASGMKSFERESESLTSKCSFGFTTSVDILIATPGRLIDHLSKTKGFTLAHLQFLVVDEADRLLGQSYFSWIEEIFKGIYYSANQRPVFSSWPGNTRCMHSQLPYSKISDAGLPLHKLLFSATLTQNPEKLASLQLFNPIMFTESEDKATETGAVRYRTPKTLTEKMLVCPSEARPLAILHMIINLKYKHLLCFTSSIDATHRLYLLLKHFGGISVAEFSSTLNQTQRKGILREFRAGHVDVLVCSDAMARGMDIDGVEYVVSYHPPTNIKTYIHRVGRTARAGHNGVAITVLSPNEVFHFKKMLSKADSRAEKMQWKEKACEGILEQYKASLEMLKNDVTAMSS